MTAVPEVVQDIRPNIDPRLVGAAAMFGLEIHIDNDAIRQALPHLYLPGTESPEYLEVEAKLRREAIFKDVYEAHRIVSEGDTEGTRVVVYYSHKDVKKQRDHQEVMLPAMREAINTGNPDLQRAVTGHSRFAGNRALTNTLISVAAPTVAIVFGVGELGDLVYIPQEATETFQILSGISTAAVSSLAVMRYGSYLSQKSELKRSPYQKQGQPIPEDLPPIVQFKPLADAA